MPLVSVLMGTHDEEDKNRVASAIDSILNQTFSDFEFIICDDGSKRVFFEWLREYGEKDSRIILLRNERNRGLAAVLNRCMEQSSGEFFARMDADDFSEKERLEKQIRFMNDHPQYALAGCNAWMVDKDGVWGVRRVKEYPRKEDFLYTSPFIHPSVVMRREAAENVGGYCEDARVLRTEDYDFFMRLYAAGYRGCNLQECLFRYTEDRQAYDRREYRFRLNEYRTRFRGFRALGILNGNMRYVVKPLLAGLIPRKIAWRARMRKFRLADDEMGTAHEDVADG